MFKYIFKNHLSNFTTAPFIFVGSGMSRRYINTPTWNGLLEELVSRLGLPRPFEYYYSISNGDLTKIASKIGEDFNELWWSKPDFEESRQEYARLARSNYSPLKFEICKYLNGKETDHKSEYAAEINLFKKINIDGIITTNWDSLLELLFPELTKYVGQEELIFSETFTIGEIYKIHGCVKNPESLTLTAEDYSEFHSRNPYLAAKLLTIFMEHPVIFLGYSLDDKNIQEILKSVIKCLTKDNIDKLTDRLIFCQWNAAANEPSITDSTILISDTILPIKLVQLNKFDDLFEVLSENKKRLPIKVLRQMKGMVYDFVKTSDPKSKVFVSDNLDDLEDYQNVEFVYGVGIKDKLSEVGIKGITAQDLFRDLLVANEWNHQKIARVLLPSLSNTYLPFFKYLRKGGYLNDDGNIEPEIDIKEFNKAFIEKVNSIDQSTFEPSASYQNKRVEINAKYSSFDALKDECEFFHILMYTPLLEENKIDLESLRGFLIINLDELRGSKYGTHYRKLICLYDYLKYKRVAATACIA